MVIFIQLINSVRGGHCDYSPRVQKNQTVTLSAILSLHLCLKSLIKKQSGYYMYRLLECWEKSLVSTYDIFVVFVVMKNKQFWGFYISKIEYSGLQDCDTVSLGWVFPDV
jgi:hypothetical protein